MRKPSGTARDSAHARTPAVSACGALTCLSVHLSRRSPRVIGHDGWPGDILLDFREK
jgi:hypothetical protein